MLILLLAVQISSTSCIPDYSGGAMCTTMSSPPMPDMSQEAPAPHARRSGAGGNYILDLFDVTGAKHHRKVVGQMLAKGDCAGAEKYALEKGELDLADRVQARCETSAAPLPTKTSSPVTRPRRSH